MSKVTNALNQIWYQQDGEQIKIGLTRSFLDTLDECWHILPGGRSVKAKAPLMTVETNDSLVSILSPVAGNLFNWNERATNFPDKLTEDDVVLTLTTARVAEAAPPTDQITALHRRIQEQAERHARERELDRNRRRVLGGTAAGVSAMDTVGFGAPPVRTMPHPARDITGTATTRWDVPVEFANPFTRPARDTRPQDNEL